MVTDAGRRQDLLVWLKELMLVGQSVFLMSRSQKGNVVGVEQYKEGQLSLSLMLSMVLENIKNSNRSMRQRCKYCQACVAFSSCPSAYLQSLPETRKDWCRSERQPMTTCCRNIAWHWHEGKVQQCTVPLPGAYSSNVTDGAKCCFITLMWHYSPCHISCISYFIGSDETSRAVKLNQEEKT